MTRALWLAAPWALVAGVAFLGFTGGANAALISAAAISVIPILILIGFAVFDGTGPHRAGTTTTEKEIHLIESAGLESSSFLAGLWNWAALGLAVRLTLVVVVNASPLWLAFGGDSITWEYYGSMALAQWSGASIDTAASQLGTGELSLFAAINAVAIAIFGSSRYPVSILNAFVGVLAAYLMGRLALELFGRKAARRAFVWGLFYPSLVLWSTMNLREVWAHVSILLVLLAGQKMRMQFSPVSIGVLVVSLASLLFIRPYLVPIVLFALIISALVVSVRQLPYALAGLAVLALLVGSYGETLGVTSSLLSEKSLHDIHDFRMALAYGGSAYGTEVDTRTLAGSLMYLPEGIARFLFSPFPWSIRSSQQLLAAPESLLFVFLVAKATREAVTQLVRHTGKTILPILASVSITVVYALVSGNEGTAFRHRSQVVIVILLFVAAREARKSMKPAAS